jgi:hypothetical protein
LEGKAKEIVREEEEEEEEEIKGERSFIDNQGVTEGRGMYNALSGNTAAGRTDPA